MRESSSTIKSLFFQDTLRKDGIVSAVPGNSYSGRLRSVTLKMINTDGDRGEDVKLERQFLACLRLKVSWKIGR